MNPFRTNGPAPSLDDLNRTLLVTGAGAMLLKMFFEQGQWPRLVLSAIAFAALLFALLRLMSKDPSRTNMQNMKFLTAVTAAKSFLRRIFRRPEQSGTQTGKGTNTPKRKRPTLRELKQYKYFMCPQCALRLRVPRGKGRLRVTCTRCGNRFEIKS